MSTGEPNHLSLALAISGGGDPRHPLRGTPLLHIKSSDAVLKNLILVADRTTFPMKNHNTRPGLGLVFLLPPL